MLETHRWSIRQKSAVFYGKAWINWTYTLYKLYQPVFSWVSSESLMTGATVSLVRKNKLAMYTENWWSCLTSAAGPELPEKYIEHMNIFNTVKSTNEETWFCCEPTRLSLESLFDLDQCDLWRWPLWPLTSRKFFLVTSPVTDGWTNKRTDRQKAISTGGV